MRLTRKGVIAVGLLAAVSTAAIAAGNYETYPQVGQPSFCASSNPNGPGVGGVTGQQGTPSNCVQTVPAGPSALTGSELVPADTAQTGSSPPQSVTIPSGLLANMSGTPRNYLENGSLGVQQRGTGIVTCGATGAPVYGADRWACSANVTSGAGRSSLVTTASLLPAGFQNVNELYRNSGSLAQPICAIQEIASGASTALAGKTVTLSVYEAALAGLAADNNSMTTLSIIYGTGADEGLGTLTASPAITPAWTGIGFMVNQQPVTISTTPTRYSVTGAVPATATEVGVEICFTPTTGGSGGTTDGFAWTGAQLEVAPSPTAYEFHPYGFDLAAAQRYYWQWAETVSGYTVVPGICSAQSTTVATCNIPLKATMRKAPTITCAFGTLKRMVAGTETALSACAAAATTNGVAGTDALEITATVASGDTAGFSGILQSGNSTGGGLITATADF
jgi:hypothetical protein